MDSCPPPHPAPLPQDVISPVATGLRDPLEHRLLENGGRGRGRKGDVILPMDKK